MRIYLTVNISTEKLKNLVIEIIHILTVNKEIDTPEVWQGQSDLRHEKEFV